jgi:hypothetical protein
MEHPTRAVQSVAVFGGNSDSAVATVGALADAGLRRVPVAVRDPQHAQRCGVAPEVPNGQDLLGAS